jgi:hypothetical protein
MWPAAIKRTYFFTKASDIFAQFNQIWIFSESYRKSSISKLMEIRPVGAAIIHTERETDGHDEAYCANVSKNMGQIASSFARDTTYLLPVCLVHNSSSF